MARSASLRQRCDLMPRTHFSQPGSVRYRTDPIRPDAQHFYMERAKPVSTVRRHKMLWTIAVILVVLWLLGLVSSYTMGGFIHVLLVLAVIVVVMNLIQGRRV